MDLKGGGAGSPSNRRGGDPSGAQETKTQVNTDGLDDWGKTAGLWDRGGVGGLAEPELSEENGGAVGKVPEGWGSWMKSEGWQTTVESMERGVWSQGEANGRGGVRAQEPEVEIGDSLTREQLETWKSKENLSC